MRSMEDQPWGGRNWLVDLLQSKEGIVLLGAGSRPKSPYSAFMVVGEAFGQCLPCNQTWC